jgi:hypothetical protein
MGGRENEVRIRDQAALVVHGRRAVGPEARVLVEAVVDEPPAASRAETPGQRLPERVLHEEDRVLDALVGSDPQERVLGLLERIVLEPARVDVQRGDAGNGDVEDVLRQARDARLAVEPEKRGAQVEDAMAVRREAREQLLRPLEPEVPVDDREGDQVEAAAGCGGTRRGCGGVAQGSNLSRGSPLGTSSRGAQRRRIPGAGATDPGAPTRRSFVRSG